MPTHAVSTQRHAVNLYLLGLGFVMLGAFLMDWFDSTLPMAACASTALMLCLPLFRQLALRHRGRVSGR